MKRSLLTVVAVLAILLQGLYTAWAVMPLAPATASPAHHAAATDNMQGMPCHQHQQQARPLHRAGCQNNDCQCRALCAMSASAAVPMASPRLDSYIASHFVAAPVANAAAPAHTLHRFRPPITLSS